MELALNVLSQKQSIMAKSEAMFSVFLALQMPDFITGHFGRKYNSKLPGRDFKFKK